MTLFGKITQILAGFRESSIENSPENQNLFTQEEKTVDSTASAETAQIALDNLGQQFAAQRMQFISSDGVPNKDGGYTVSVHPTELGGKRWSKEITPQQVTEKAVEKLLDDLNIKDPNLRKEAIAKLGSRELIFELGKEKTQKKIKTGDFGERDLMLVSTNKLGAIEIKFDAQTVNRLKEWAKAERINELAATRQTNEPIKTETAMLGSTAVLNLPRAIPLIEAAPLKIAAAGAVVPAVVIGTQVGAIAWTADQIVMNAERNWEQETRINSLPLPPTIITNKAKENAKPETTVADKITPQVQPIPDEAELPKGELVVRPKAQPQTPTKADNPATPTIENVPSPYKPSQPNSPNTSNLNRIIPGTITVGALSKLAYDKIRDKSYELTAEDIRELQEIANHRTQNGMPVVSAEGTTGTVAVSEINGQKIYGHSTVIQRNSKIGDDNRAARESLLKELQNDGVLPNKPYGSPAVLVVTHAEIEIMIEEQKKFGSLEGKDIKITVDREPCPDCFRLIPQLAAKWKMGTITIISENPKTGAGKVTVFKPQDEGVK